MAFKKVKNMKLSVEELNLMTKEELISRFLQIQDHNIQLKNILHKYQLDSFGTSEKSSRHFDFEKCDSQKIFLKFLYLGWDYQGFASVEDSLQTVEHQVLEAMKKCCLIQSRETSDYHRCGRTDKGVSAFSQVISLKVRKGKEGAELDYVGILNRVLPGEIRVTGWCPIKPEISARFNCTSRLYRYLFPKADLDLQAMKEAALYLKGVHDFRNLCKMDVANGVTNFTREIMDINIVILDPSPHHGYSMCEARVLGSGFLWHQVRCIMAVLMMVGQGQEQPHVTRELLDIEMNPKKPQYSLASELGLCLFDVKFDVDTPWHLDQVELSSVVSRLQGIWTTFAIKAETVMCMLRELEQQVNGPSPRQQAQIIVGFKQPKQHKPLLQRNTCQSLEERVEHYSKKLKIDKMSEDSVENLSQVQSSSLF